MPLEKIITFLLISAVGAYLAAWLTLLIGRKRLGAGIFGIGWIIAFVLFVINWTACGHPPFGNMYHVLLFLSLAFPPLYLVIAVRYKLRWTHLYFAFSSAIPLIGSLFMDRNVFWRRVPALQSPWFVPHVFAYMVSYALATVAFVLIVAMLIKGRLFKRGDIERYSEASCQIVRLAFPFMTFGLLSGALWAEQAWGVYWSWDPKETWSLITWTLYLIYLHCRSAPNLRRYADIAQILGFLALLSTFLLVNLLPKLASILHSYT